MQTVVARSAWLSKINWTQGVAVLAAPVVEMVAPVRVAFAFLGGGPREGIVVAHSATLPGFASSGRDLTIFRALPGEVPR